MRRQRPNTSPTKSDPPAFATGREDTIQEVFAPKVKLSGRTFRLGAHRTKVDAERVVKAFDRLTAAGLTPGAACAAVVRAARSRQLDQRRRTAQE